MEFFKDIYRKCFCKQREEDTVCTCRQDVKTKKASLLLVSVIAALIMTALVVCIVLLAQADEPSNNPSINAPPNNTGDNTNNSGGNNTGGQDNPNTDSGNNDNQNNLTKINPFAFVDQVDYYGYDGQGEISVTPRRDDLIIAIIGECPETDDEEILTEWLQKFMSYDAAIDDIKISYSKNNNLKNGDTVIVSIVVPEFLSDKIGNASKTYIVSGLPAIDFVEIFDDIRISYEGVSGQAFAVVERLSNSELFSSCRFEITPNGNLSNGDQITISITNKDWLANVFNVVPRTLSKTFIVEGLSSYVTSAEQLPLEDVRQIAQQFYEDKKRELVYDGYFTYENITYDGAYLYVLDESALFGYKNILRMTISYELYMHGAYVRTDTLYLDFINIVIDQSGKTPISYEDGATIWFDEVDYKKTKID